MRRKLAPAWLWAAGFAACLGLAALRHVPQDPPLSTLENALIDLRFRIRGPRPAPEGVLIVAIDDESLASVGLMAPLRESVASAVQRLEAARARSIVIDLMLVEPTSADGRLAGVLSGSPSTILAVAAAPGGVGQPSPEIDAALRDSAFPVVVRFGPAPAPSWPLLLPVRQLAVAAGALGHVNIALAQDRVARRVPLAIDVAGDLVVPSVALVAANRAFGGAARDMRFESGRSVQVAGTRIDTDAAGRVLLNFFGGPRAIETVRLDDLVAGRVDPARVEGHAVFIGASAAALGDTFATPFAADVAGVEILGTLAANLVDDELMRAGGAVLLGTAFIALACVALTGFAVSVPASTIVAAVATACAWIATLAALQIAFNARYALDAATVILALLLATAANWLWRLSADQTRRHDLEAERSRLAGYMSPFAATIMPQGGETPDWRTEPATIGFVDVVGSVGLAEGRSPKETAVYLALVQGHIARTAERHGGAVVERAGDGALVVFGFGSQGGAREALDFARDVVHDASDRLRMRVSLQHGPVALADLGGGPWGHIALAGDTVNVAARLQDAAKRSGRAIVVGRAVLDAAGVDLATEQATLLALPPETVRGRQRSVEVWAVAD